MKVFISHSSYDKWVARQLSRILEGEGHDTFLDEKDIQTGDSIDAKIQEHLKDADHLLLLLSPASIKSQWVFIELGGARALGKKIVPIVYHLGANEIPQIINQLLARDLNEFDTYVSELKGKPAKKATAPSTPSKKKSPLKKGPFNVGDMVRIVRVENLTAEDKATPPNWVETMDKYSGVSTQVNAVTPQGNLLLAADSGMHKWSFKWVALEA